MPAVLEDHRLLVETPKRVRRIGVSARVRYLVKWKGCPEHESIGKSEMDRHGDLIKDSVGAVLVRKGLLVTMLLQNLFLGQQSCGKRLQLRLPLAAGSLRIAFQKLMDQSILMLFASETAF